MGVGRRSDASLCRTARLLLSVAVPAWHQPGGDGAVDIGRHVIQATWYAAVQAAAYNLVNLAPSNLTSFLGARSTAHG